MNKCVSINHPDFIELVRQSGLHPAILSAKMGVWMESNSTDEWPSLEQLGLSSGSINYNLKLIDSLLKLQRNKFESSKLQGWTNDLQKQGVPKEQIEMFKESAKDGMTKDEILSSTLANYSYSVEINTVKTKSLDKYTKHNTSYYSNLTVPGGTNYTENEISTPLITPSIKGHAQFATDKGIGWFRSDEQVNDEEYKTAPDLMNPFKTRRILEIQSDLFQKGRTHVDLINTKYEDVISADKEFIVGVPFQNEEYSGLRVINTFDTQQEADTFVKRNNAYKLFTKEEAEMNFYNIEYKNKRAIVTETKENQFLQLLNKDNNWVTFFIKSIMQDSIKKGYEKVLFPKGETAAKIEGHETLANEIIKLNKEIERIKNIPLTKEFIGETNEGEPIYEENRWEYNDQGVPFRSKSLDELNRRKSELKSQGIEKLKPIEAFYEIKIGNILEKQFGKDNVKISNHTIQRKEVNGGSPKGALIENDIDDEEYTQAKSARKLALEKIKTEEKKPSNASVTNPFGAAVTANKPSVNPFGK